MTETERDLLQAVCDRHDDDMPRLVYADWCDENGDPARAELIRLQIAMSRPRRGGWPPDDVRRLEAMTASVGASLLSAIDMPKMGVKFRRGFIEEVTLRMSAYWGGSCPRNCIYGERDVNGSTYRCPDCHKGWVDGFGERTAWRWPLTCITLVGREPDVIRAGWFGRDRASYVWWVGNEMRRRERKHTIPQELMEIIRHGDRGRTIEFETRDQAVQALSAAALSHYRTGKPATACHGTTGWAIEGAR